MSEKEIKTYEIVIHFLIEAKNREDALIQFNEEFGSNIINDCNEYVVYGD